MMHPRRWPLRLRLLLFAFGDFAFNLYWQSIMLFLLFYYTDAISLPVTVAATIFTIASIWDGIANFAAGVVVDRRKITRSYGAVLMLGSIPLGLTFTFTYLPPLSTGFSGIAILFTAHLLFRSAYAAVNVPYLAMTSRISTDSRDRTFLAGMRMLCGTMAAVLVALGTTPMGSAVTGSGNAAEAYFGAAMIFAVVGTAILLLVGATYEELDPPVVSERPSLATSLRSIAANRAFVTLNLAMMSTIVAITVINKSVLYYFKYFLDDEAGGQIALASMGLISAVAVPAWMFLSRPMGLRGLWFMASGLGMAGLVLFAAVVIDEAALMQLFLVGMQVMIVGLNFVFWAMLPNTIEFGEKVTGVRVEGTVFGMAALLQRVAIGIATAILGWSFGSAGYIANVTQSTQTLAAMAWTMALVPLGFLALSFGLMLLNPLGKGVHARIVEDLKRGTRA